MFAIIIFANMWERGLSRFSLLTRKNRLLTHLRKLWHKMTFNVITATLNNLHKQPKWGSVTTILYLEYFGTYLGYLSTNHMSQHSDTFPVNPTLNPRHSTSSLTAELVLFLLRNSYLDTLRISLASRSHLFESCQIITLRLWFLWACAHVHMYALEQCRCSWFFFSDGALCFFLIFFVILLACGVSVCAYTPHVFPHYFIIPATQVRRSGLF